VTVLDQPRDEVGRFATKACPAVYALLDELAPVEGTEGRYHRVPAPRCPHNHFARWAARNCKQCR
jgi:hypothetical protein